MSKIILFIPCYNCENQIVRVIKQLENNDNYKYFSEILLIDNRSLDNTVGNSISRLKNSNIDNVKVLKNSQNLGLGGTHKVAFRYAKESDATHVAVLHGDDQGDIEDLIKLLKNSEYNNYDCCLGSRFHHKSRLRGYSKLRIVGNWVFNSIFSICSGKLITDLGSGLNIYKVTSIENDRIVRFSNDLTFNCYMILFSVSQHHKIKFFDITWKEEDQISNVKLFSQAKKTLKIALSFLFNRENSLVCKNNTIDFSSVYFDELYKSERNG
ncbi:glycosyltransferase family 2 protein [Vibrio fluvialis]|uniref:glycosyltransferase family 2 protein n=1 Tax=Vibrio fluvialis TaxID=676 RepID=UPI00192C2373|nr:glycosyltransferase family 2 protein [Vibrio fluvialis]MBL4262782.1 glycosyltransferase family 2 protein [Vibrio fluvialis]MBY7889893.1 glycosyltransferase family 2 protein [Vibrio fluvialis]